MPRSGTNFLADALSKHPKVARSPGQFWEYVPFRFQSSLEGYLAQVASSKHAHEFAPNEMLSHFGNAWIDFLASEVSDRRLLVFKEPSIDGLASMFKMYADCRSVIIVRDGRDIVSSALKSDFVLPPRQWTNRSHLRRFLPDEDFRILCRSFAKAARSLSDFLASEDAEHVQQRIYLVKYEDLVADPRNQLNEMMRWAELPPEEFDWEAFESMPVRGSSFLRGDDGQHDFGTGVQRPKEGFQPTRRWENWSSRRKNYYQTVAGEVSKRLGYE
ncbi:MAG: sulfotransferase [Planctomycetota bacterium]